MEKFEETDVKFRVPGGMIIAGPSASGKSTLVMKLLSNADQMFDPPPAEIVYAYGQYQPLVSKLQAHGVRTHSGLPSEEYLATCQKPLLLVMDDLMLSASEDYLANLFTKKNHHENLFSIFLAQSLFEKNLKVARNNSQYILLTRAPNALLSIRTLGSQLFPRQLSYFLDAYNQATKQIYGYLMVDLHAASNPKLKLQTSIFPGDTRVIFVPQNA